METIRFVFWEIAKVLALVFLAVVAVKSLRSAQAPIRWLKTPLYVLILVFVALGAWYAGNDVAAEVYMWSADSSLARGDLVRAYANAIQAVNLRPNNLSYWHTLMRTKMTMRQLDSVLDDQPSITALSGGNLDEEDEYQFSLCDFFLGHYDKVITTTLRLIRQNPAYGAPYVLQGLACTAEKKFPEAQQSFLAVLQIFPNNQAAVENLARAYYLGGDHERSRAVLDETSKFPFDPSARARFEALKGLYDQ
jgi:tetratricopeptide (TPR) repeat protein